MTSLVAGYGIVWGVQFHGFIPMPGAYRKAIEAHKAAGTAPLMLFNHEPDRVLGQWTSFAEDEKGLRVAGALNLALRGVREIYFAVRRGDVRGLSIGNAGQPSDFKVAAAPGRPDILVEHPLSEISICAFPRCPVALIDDIGL